QGGESPTANDGTFERTYTVPKDAEDGAEICDQAMLSGPSPRDDYERQISNPVCHRVSRDVRREQPPCRDRCAERQPCDRCGERQPSCERGCAEKPKPSCDK